MPEDPMRKKRDYKELETFQQQIQYTFCNRELLMQALTHSSYANEHKHWQISSNERLEFLGDAILDLIISEYIYKEYPALPEGELTKLRASVVCEPSLAEGARKIRLGDFLYLGKGESFTGGRARDSILADAFESIIGAIYLDSTMEHAKHHVLNILIPFIDKMQNDHVYMDFKTHLQEIIQKSSKESIEYHIIKEMGPDHNKEFYVEVRHNKTVLGTGKGKSKKEAEQNAAWQAINAATKL